jgi:hypothetical protein
MLGPQIPSKVMSAQTVPRFTGRQKSRHRGEVTAFHLHDPSPRKVTPRCWRLRVNAALRPWNEARILRLSRDAGYCRFSDRRSSYRLFGGLRDMGLEKPGPPQMIPKRPRDPKVRARPAVACTWLRTLRLPPGMRRTPAMTEERCAKGRESTEPPARANQTGPVHRAAGWQDLRTRIVRRGVRAVCGPSTADECGR